MTVGDSRGKADLNVYQSSRLWLSISIVAVILAVTGNIIALTVDRIYAGLTVAFLSQALAQDIANLVIVAPAWVITALLASRGSLRAYLLFLGVLAFTVYNYVIYAFSIPFGPLFLLWVAVFGFSLHALIYGVTTVNHERTQSCFTNQRVITVVAWFLILTAALFSLLWLSEDVPALFSGRAPQSLIEMALPTNPVHILDLGFFLPTAVAIGVLLLKRKPIAYTVAAPFILFFLLTGIPILLTPVVQAARGQVAGWDVVVPIGTLTLLSAGLLGWLLSTVRT
jgi:hypothetical protein